MSDHHDLCFKSIFKLPENARDGLKLILPKEISAHLDLEQIHLESSSYIDERLTERHSDLLFTVPIKDQATSALIYLLFEHQSSVDPLMPLRLLVYTARVIEGWLREGRAPAPILPLLLSQAPTPWRRPLCLTECLCQGLSPELAVQIKPHLPELKPLLLDLASTDEEALPVDSVAGLTLRLFKHIFKTQPEWYQTWADALGQLLGPLEDQGTLECLLRYSAEASASLDSKSLIEAFRRYPRVEEKMASIADAWRAEGETRGRVEGEARGRVEGRVEGTRATLLKLIELRLGPAAAEEAALRLASADESELLSLTTRLFGATRLDDLFPA